MARLVRARRVPDVIAYAGLGLLIAGWYAGLRGHKRWEAPLTVVGFALIVLGVLAR